MAAASPRYTEPPTWHTWMGTSRFMSTCWYAVRGAQVPDPYDVPMGGTAYAPDPGYWGAQVPDPYAPDPGYWGAQSLCSYTLTLAHAALMPAQ